ncbi:MAG: PLP-dependent aminotransferase family protein [Lachnospiraceae bacterium]|nr:PLP-dependent aminotransferase family protein [Lachnospiraceae bacterium]
MKITKKGEFYMTRYIEIYEDIRRKIADGVYEFGTKLPSKRVTAENYSVSVITVEHAYELLIEEGYAVSREKSGYFVSYRENEYFADNAHASRREHAQAPAKSLPGGHNIRPGITGIITSPKNNEEISFNIYAKTVRRVLSDYGDAIKERPEPYGCEILRMAIANYLAKNRGIKTDCQRIVIGSGAEYLYGLIVRALGRNKIYAIENPSYRKISDIYAAEGIVTDKLDLGSDGIESGKLLDTKAQVLHVTPYRSFPTGVTASAAKKAEYISWSKKKNGIIIEDDFESEFSSSRKPEETLFSKDTEGRVIYVNTFSRTVGSFMRTAYMVLPAELEELFREKIGFYSCTVPALEQYVLAELINNGDFVRHINRVRRKRREA